MFLNLLNKIFNVLEGNMNNNGTPTQKISVNGCRTYFNESGDKHRVNGPAVEYPNGDFEYWLNGKKHRLGGPAVSQLCGNSVVLEYFIDGKKYQMDEYLKHPFVIAFVKNNKEALIKKSASNELVKSADEPQKSLVTMTTDGTLMYLTKDGKYHREDGPAIEHLDGHKEWWVNGQLHRVDGPAIEHADEIQEWFIDGKKYSEEEFKQRDSDMNSAKMTIDKNGNKIYLKNNQYHRISGPACEYANGDKSWFINGQLHRVGGPACEYADGQKSWYISGRLHRLDGPAIEYPNGKESWYIDGIQYSEEEYNGKIKSLNKNNVNKPELSIEEKDSHGNYFYKNRLGQYHNENGPSIKWANGDIEWHIDGKRHREDGPAVETYNGNKEWWFHGKRHRLDGPAKEYKLGFDEWYINDSKYTKESYDAVILGLNNKKYLDAADKLLGKDVYFTENNQGKFWRNSAGKYHRQDGPAIEWNNGLKEWYIDGKVHRTDGPAKEYSDGTKEWWNNGLLHRLDGPAVEYHDDDYEWFKNGLLHRLDGPAQYIAKDSSNKETFAVDGIIIKKLDYERFYIPMKNTHSPVISTETDLEGRTITKYKNLDGLLHRVGGPAYVSSNVEEWFYEGKLHRVDGPASINKINGKMEYYMNGELHRLDGPAIEFSKESGNRTEEYYLFGKWTSKESFIKFTKVDQNFNDDWADTTPIKNNIVPFANKKDDFSLPKEAGSDLHKASVIPPTYTPPSHTVLPPVTYTATSTQYTPLKPTLAFEMKNDIVVFGSAKHELNKFKEEVGESINSTDLVLNCTADLIESKPWIKSKPKWMELTSRDINPFQIQFDWREGEAPYCDLSFWKNIIERAFENDVTKIIVCCSNGKGKTGTALAALMVADGWEPQAAIDKLNQTYSKYAVETQAQRNYILDLK